MKTYYLPPEHGWTCFHCGETFTARGAARDHFGSHPTNEAACRIKAGAERGLVMALREAEIALADAQFALEAETSDIAKAYREAVARYKEQIFDAEEAGYQRGMEAVRRSKERNQP